MESSVAFVMQLSLVAAWLKSILIWLGQMFLDRRNWMFIKACVPICREDDSQNTLFTHNWKLPNNFSTKI